MVHNAPVEVWIKFGLLGVGIFFAIYYILFRDIWRRRRRQRMSDLLAFGAGAYLLGNFVVICTVYAWPFSTWEKSILVFTLIAMAYPPNWRAASQPTGTRS
jgi:O-antigen ligase